MTVLDKPLSELVPAAYNPRKQLPTTSPAYRKLRVSLEAFGLVEPLVWNAASGHVVGGHLRLRILKDLGHTHAPVAVVDLPPDREKALNIVLNNREAQGQYDAEKLRDLLEELEELPAYAETGFDRAALTALRFDPAPDVSESPLAGRVEVTLVTDAAGYEALSADLDAVVRKHDLETHVRRL